MSFRNKIFSSIVLLAIPCAASAEEWRFCIGGDQVGDVIKAPMMYTDVFRADLEPGYQQSVAAHIERNTVVTGTASVDCSDPFATQDDAYAAQNRWRAIVTEGEVAMELLSLSWEPAYLSAATAPEPARQITPNVARTTQAAKPASASEPPSPAAQDATRETAAQQAAASAEAQRQAEQRRQYWEQQRAASAGAGSSAGAGAKPLRFVLAVGLRPQAGDTSNPSCYSNIITRPGPPGWGAPGFLPTGTAEQAIQTIEGLKAAFVAKCRAASGREIDGSINHWRNQSERDEAELGNVRARGREDVTVQMD